MEPVTETNETQTSTDESRPAIVNIADAKRERSLSSREGKLKQAEQAYDDFFRALTETLRMARTTIQRVDEDGVVHTETVPGLSGGSHGPDCTVTTNAREIRPRRVAFEKAMNKMERVIFAMKSSQWHLVPKDLTSFIQSLWATVPPVVGDAPLPPASEAE